MRHATQRHSGEPETPSGRSMLMEITLRSGAVVSVPVTYFETTKNKGGGLFGVEWTPVEGADSLAFLDFKEVVAIVARRSGTSAVA